MITRVWGGDCNLATQNIDSKLLEAFQASTCFGLAHDPTVPECKQCDVQAQCKIKSEGANIPVPTKRASKPEAPKEDKPVSEVKKKSPVSNSTPKPANKPKPAPAKKTSSAPSGNLPDFKPMTLEDLKELAKERNVEWKEYGNDNITRMRLIMALKPTYQ